LALVPLWAAEHRAELMEDWDLCSRMQTAAEPTPPVRPCAPWRVADVEALPGFRLRVRFNDGTEGAVEMAEFIASAGAGVFTALRDEKLFRQARVVLGAVT
jgi:Protein of unknown function (DUF2442)